jgi:tetratricopeptide (TPR) repeat protein
MARAIGPAISVQRGMSVAPHVHMSVEPCEGTARAADRPGRTARWLLSGLLVVAIAAVYAPVGSADFFYLDDDFYVTDNPAVRDGLTTAGLRQAFFGSRGALWMPLAFTSHMIDVSLFGLTPRGPHVVNVALHAVNALLLLGLLWRATGALGPSVAAAALFALHPLRVESVAWIAERKDVLSALFGLLTLHVWVSFTREPTSRRYRSVALGTILALMSKPMLVTLPLLLLCFDWWPLRRVGATGPDGRSLSPMDLVREKMPLLAVAFAAAAITLLAAGMQGALVALDNRSLPARLAHAIVAYVWYAGKTIWPTDLAVFYPYPAWTGWQLGGAMMLVAATVTVVVRTRHSAPWVGAGLAWFALGLLPVIGIFQAGGQGMADRFTYMPAIGLMTAVVWTLHHAARTRMLRAVLAGTTVVVTALLAIVAHRQVRFWTTSEAMLTHTIAVTHENWRVETALGNVLANQGRHPEAYAHFARAHRMEPNDAGSAYGLGLALDSLGRPDEAVEHYRETLRLDPSHWRAHNNLGVFLVRHGDVEASLHHFSEAVRLNPDARDATDNLRSALAVAGFPKENTDGYMKGLLAWSAAIASDLGTARGAAYSVRLESELFQSHPALMQECAGVNAEGKHPPFSLYVQVDAAGALTAVTAMPPTPTARCIRDELRTAHAPSPPFAPFHAIVSVPAEG